MIPILTASTVFSSMAGKWTLNCPSSQCALTFIIAVFNMLTEQMRETFRRIPLCANGVLRPSPAMHSRPNRRIAKVSLQRLSDFLGTSELLDNFSEPSEKDVAQSREISDRPEDADAIGFCNASFVWSNDDSPEDQSARKFELMIDGKLVFRQGELNLIFGPSGSGKTSLLMALLGELLFYFYFFLFRTAHRVLGEMHFISSGPESWHNLPRRKGVAFASQESWVQNETIRNNILFGAPYDEVRYKKGELDRVLQLVHI